MKRLIRFAVPALLPLFANFSQAASLSDFDLDDFDFNVTELSVTSTLPGNLFTAFVSGETSGINWSISETLFWGDRTITDGTFSFAALPVTTDSVHLGSDFTITFDARISTLIVALSNDNLTDSIDFGLLPSDTSGITMNGTQVVLDAPSGGLALFENIDSFTINNIDGNGINDGYDLAFYAITSDISDVPLPGAAWLFGSAFACFFGLRKSRNRVGLG